VPKEARQTGPVEFKLTDRGGKNWVFRQTPFGIQKAEDKAQDAQSDAGTAERQTGEAAAVKPGTTMPTPFGATRSRDAVPVRVTEDGDTLRFERQTPFGVQRWSKTKSELSEQETQLWEAQRNSSNQNKSK